VAVYRRTSRPRFTLLLLILTAVTLLTLDERGGRFVTSMRDHARDAFAPVSDAANAVFDPIGNALQGVVHYGDLEAENARLRDELAARDGDRLRSVDQERQLKALLDQQELDYVGDIPTVAARVIGGAPNAYQLTVELDRGRDHGVSPGMPVVSGAGLVGRVIDASSTHSTVLLITDRTSSVGVRLTGSGDTGVADGKGRGRALGVELIDPSTAVKVGEVVVTSGLQQSLYPPGVPVAKVVAAKALPGALSQDVTADPVVDLQRLSFVRVLQWSSRP
jgi:rod shape-determining protein MreC